MTKIKLEQGIWLPIDAVAKGRDRVMVRRGPAYAVAYWTGNMWAYPDGPVEQIDFDPREYRV